VAEARAGAAAAAATAAADVCFAAAAALRRRLDVQREEVVGAVGLQGEEASEADGGIRALEERAAAMAAEHAAALQPVEANRKTLDDAATEARVAEAGALQTARVSYQAVANYEEGARARHLCAHSAPFRGSTRRVGGPIRPAGLPHP
jgi:hypothetical protein